jgi:hypothetical protein
LSSMSDWQITSIQPMVLYYYLVSQSNEGVNSIVINCRSQLHQSMS